MPTLTVDTLPVVEWEAWTAQPMLAGVTVFRYQLNVADQIRLWVLLQPDEQQRAARFRQSADRHRFVAGRGWLRLIAGQLTHTPADQIRLETGPFGKPDLPATMGWHLNASHTGEWVVLVFGPTPVGVDVEWINPQWDYQDVAALSFSADEQNLLTNSTDPTRLFYTFWTRKESLLKAVGQGLTNDVSLFPASKGEHWIDQGLPTQPESGPESAPERWSIRSFPVAEAYIGAVTSQEMSDSIRFFTLNTTSLDFTAF